jgi:hypothetical protein
MIRVFHAFGKSFLNCHSDFNRFNAIYDNLNIHSLTCPHCRAKFNCTYFSSYSRNLITFKNSSNTCYDIVVTRVKCNSCNQTHAVLPDHFIPYGSYSLSFVLTVLRAYFLGSQTKSYICNHFQIAMSTLYDWIKLFNEHKLTWLGILNDASHKPIKFIDDLISHIFSLSDFYKLTKKSFLQGSKATRSNSS